MVQVTALRVDNMLEKVGVAAPLRKQRLLLPRARTMSVGCHNATGLPIRGCVCVEKDQQFQKPYIEVYNRQ